MSKSLKIGIVVLVALVFFLFGTIKVDAVNIQSEDSLKQIFEGKNVTIERTTIILNENVSFEGDGVYFSDLEYVLDLNGYSLTTDGMFVNSGKLTIKDATGKGKVVGAISNELNAKLTIENGTFNSVSTYGELNIKGGKFLSENSALYIYADFAKVTLSGGEFESTANPGMYGAILIEKSNSLENDFIQQYASDGYDIYYDWYGRNTYTSSDGNIYYYGNYGTIAKVVKPTEKELNLIKKIAPDGKNATFKSIKPADSIEAEFILTNVANMLLDEDDYYVYAYPADSDNFDPTKCVVEIAGDSFSRKYEINVTYDEPNDNSNVKAFIDNMKDFDELDVESAYKLTDLGLINYYMTSSKSELWNRGAAARALRYSDEIINLTNGGNIKFFLDVRAGTEHENLMYENAFGEMTIFYDGYAYANKQQGIYLKRVIYIPQDTENTTEAYVLAAQKRINEYLESDNLVSVKYGGTLASLGEEYLDLSMPTDKTDGNYYNITVKGKTYKFYILKGTEEQLKEPVYQGKDYETNVEISSTDANVPLDTEINAIVVKSDDIKNVLGTENYSAYDISLYSDGKSAAIEKLENGRFKVSVLVPESLKDKEVTVYYITSAGEKEEHIAIVNNGIATFETDHFSTYVLAEKVEESTTLGGLGASEPQPEEPKTEDKGPKDETPKTGNINIINYLWIVALISGAGFVFLGKKIKNI